jgi:hypothetical protein
VFVRYEVVFQLAWVAGAFLPAILPVAFRQGILALAGFYVVVGAAYFAMRRADKVSSASRVENPGRPPAVS